MTLTHTFGGSNPLGAVKEVEYMSYWEKCKFCNKSDKGDRMYWVKRKGKHMSKEYFHLDCYRKAWGKDDNKQEMH